MLPRCRLRPRFAALLACLLAACTVVGQEPNKESLFLAVPNPITGAGVEQLKSVVDRVQTQPNTKLEKVVFDFNADGRESSSSAFGSCYELARLIKGLELNGVFTIGFVHNKLTGNAVLPALACGELCMSSAGQIGQIVEPNAGLPQKEDISIIFSYSKSELAGLVQKMFDKNTDVYSGLRKQARIYFDGRKRNEKEYADVQNPQPVDGMNPGVVELYNQVRAQKLGICATRLETREEVARDYGVNLRGDFLKGRDVKASRIEIAGAIDDALAEQIERQLKMAVARKDNTIFFVFHSDGGGDSKAAIGLADRIAKLPDDPNQPIRTIAFIPDKAPDLAGVIALACSEIVMYRLDDQSEASIADFESYLSNAVNGPSVDFLRKNLPDVLKKRGLPEVLADGMLDKNAEVLRVRNIKTNVRTLMTRDEFEKVEGMDWARDGVLKQRGGVLKLNAGVAKDIRVANILVKNRDFRDIAARFGIEEKDIRDAKPHWLDTFSAILRRTEVSALLVLIGIAGLILELKVPGLTVPGIVAALCFLLFFWAQSQMSGQIIYLALLLFLLGIILIGVEIFILPGFGVTGVAGVLLVVVGLGLATIDHIPQSNEDWFELGTKAAMFAGSMVGSIFVVVLVGRFLPQIPLADRLILSPPSDRPEDSVLMPGVEQAQALLGLTGTAQSTLRPAGLAKIGEQFVDVVSEGDYIEAGTSIQVVEVEGTRIVVKRVG